MLFGDNQLFAIDVRIDERVGSWVLGAFLCWIRGVLVGNPKDSADLKGCLRWMRDLVEQPRNRFDPRLRGLDPKNVFELLHAPVVAGARVEPPIRDAFARFNISHVGMSSFDRFDILLIEEPGAGQRALWREGDNSDIRDAYLPPGQIQKTARECIAWLQEKIDQRP